MLPTIQITTVPINSLKRGFLFLLSISATAKPLPVYGKSENVCDWLYVVDHAHAIDIIFHNGKIAETYKINGFNEWKNIDIILIVIKTVDKLLGRPEGTDLDLITYVTDCLGHNACYVIDSTKLPKRLVGSFLCNLKRWLKRQWKGILIINLGWRI